MTMETQAEVNTRFWRLVHGDSGRPEHVDAARVREILVENLRRVRVPGSRTAQIDIDVLGDNDTTPLTVAIEASNIAVVRVLLDYGADCNRLGHSWQDATPLHCAMWQGLNGLEMMQLLINRGASTTVIESDGTTILHLASHVNIAENWKARIQLLLANIPHMELPRLLSTCNGDGMTPLMMAIESSDDGDEDNGVLTQMLMNAADSDLEMTCPKRWTAMAFCIHLRDPLGGGPLILRELLRHGANVETRFGLYNNTALHEAIEYDRGWAIEILLDAGADRDALNRDGYNADEWAVNNPEIMDMFAAFDAKMELHRQMCVAFASGHHARLGAGSLVALLTPDNLRGIIERGRPRRRETGV
jgi:ankyrin repeat protein